MKQYLNLKANKLITYNDKVAAVLLQRGDIAEVEIKVNKAITDDFSPKGKK